MKSFIIPAEHLKFKKKRKLSNRIIQIVQISLKWSLDWWTSNWWLELTQLNLFELYLRGCFHEISTTKNFPKHFEIAEFNFHAKFTCDFKNYLWCCQIRQPVKKLVTWKILLSKVLLFFFTTIFCFSLSGFDFWTLICKNFKIRKYFMFA